MLASILKPTARKCHPCQLVLRYVRGQNRNQFMATAMLYAVNTIPNIHTIDMKFMESGHSYLEADSIHATIERTRKHRSVYSTREWADVIEMARKKPAPYRTKVLSFEDIYDFKDMADQILHNRNLNSCKEKVKWLKIKWLRFEKSKPFEIQYKYNLYDDNFNTITVTTMHNRNKIKHQKVFSWNEIPLTKNILRN